MAVDEKVDRKAWGTAAVAAMALHGAAVIAIVAAVIPADVPLPEPVVLVELPAQAGPPAPQVASATPQEARPEMPQPQFATPPVAVPPVKAPLPSNAVNLPPPQPIRATQAAAPVPTLPNVTAPAVPRSGSEGASPDMPGNDPKAQKLEADYKSLVGAYIRRNKFSPPQSRKAGISGNVKVRFVVHRNGAISNVGVAGSSGAALLDGEAVAFLQSLTPVPSFPRDLRKSEIPLTITLKFQVESK